MSRSRLADLVALGLTRVLWLQGHHSEIGCEPFWSPETLENVAGSYLGQAHTGCKA